MPVPWAADVAVLRRPVPPSPERRVVSRGALRRHDRRHHHRARHLLDVPLGSEPRSLRVSRLQRRGGTQRSDLALSSRGRSPRSPAFFALISIAFFWSFGQQLEGLFGRGKFLAWILAVTTIPAVVLSDPRVLQQRVRLRQRCVRAGTALPGRDLGVRRHVSERPLVRDHPDLGDRRRVHDVAAPAVHRCTSGRRDPVPPDLGRRGAQRGTQPRSRHCVADPAHPARLRLVRWWRPTSTEGPRDVRSRPSRSDPSAAVPGSVSSKARGARTRTHRSPSRRRRPARRRPTRRNSTACSTRSATKAWTRSRAPRSNA